MTAVCAIGDNQRGGPNDGGPTVIRPGRHSMPPLAACPVTSKIPRHAPLTCEEESSLTTRDGNGVRFAWLRRWSGGRS